MKALWIQNGVHKTLEGEEKLIGISKAKWEEITSNEVLREVMKMVNSKGIWKRLKSL